MPRDKRLFMTFPNDFPWHPKIRRLSVDARWAFVEMNGYSRVRDLDGVIPAEDAEFEWSESVLVELLSSHPSRPLVLRDEEGNYVIREYAEHQQTIAERERLAEISRENGKKGGRPPKPGKTQPGLVGNPDITGAGPRGKQSTEYREQIDGYVIEDSLVSSEVESTSRPDVDRLCNLLADLIEANGSKRPRVGKTWHDACRLLIDKDGRRVDQIERAIRWCQENEFWRGVVMSMPKLREKYDQLRLQASREHHSDRPTRGQENLAYMHSLMSEQGEIEG